MNSTERFKIVMDILDLNDLGNCSRNHSIFEDLKDEELSNIEKVDKIIEKIKIYESSLENNSNRYSENTMQALRQRNKIDKYDTSKDEKLNKINPKEVFSEVCQWNGLLGNYDETIKGWIKDIYGIDLNDIKNKV
jgi:hypothetical protein